MARRNDHSREELREMALTAAENLLDNEGSAALSTRKIAAAIGYSAGSLYQVFKNYDDLCWQLNLRTLRMLLAQQARVAEPSVDATLLSYARQYLAFAARWPQRWSLLFEYSTPQELDTPDELIDAIAELFGLIEQALAQLLPAHTEEAISAAARTLWAGVHGIAVLRAHDKLFQTEQICAERMAEDLICRYLSGWQQEDVK